MTVTLFGAITGILVGMTGSGGGALLTPLLLVFTPYPVLTVIGTDLVTGVVTKLIGFVQHWRFGPIYWRLAGYIILGSLPGSLAGIGLIHVLKANLSTAHLDASLKGFVGLALFAASASLPYVRKKGLAESGQSVQPRRLSHGGTVAVGCAVGFLVAVTSVGSGSLLMVFMLLVVPLPISELVGTDIMLGLTTTVLAGSLHLWMGHFSEQLFGELALGSIPGVIAGSWLSHRIPERYFSWLLSFLYFSLGARLLLSW
ncbi:MAG TPA: sulfite exporter TauE/SafE family protein [Terriglobia bacterium]|nr:sulfite exporter TauE/SafE family protein [Terriglobia bacterium]